LKIYIYSGGNVEMYLAALVVLDVEMYSAAQ
jgi:hypothetical protein